jgi:hypothetical protein
MAKRYYFPNRLVEISGYANKLEITASGCAYYNDGNGSKRLGALFLPKQNILAVSMPDDKTVYITNKDGNLIETTLDEKKESEDGK